MNLFNAKNFSNHWTENMLWIDLNRLNRQFLFCRLIMTNSSHSESNSRQKVLQMEVIFNLFWRYRSVNNSGR